MTSWTTRPICAFDLETTGRDPFSARIVSAAVIVDSAEAGVPGAAPRTRNWVLDPGVEIPEDAAAIHGLSTAHVRAHGTDYVTGYREIRAALTQAWAAGYAVVAFNAAYDLTVLDAEARRLGLPPLDGYGLVLDPYVIDRAVDPERPGRRTLGALCEHYGITLDAAHHAEADALAAAALARLLPLRFPHLAALPDMMASQTAWHAERQRDLVEYLRGEGRDVSDIDGRWPIRGAA